MSGIDEVVMTAIVKAATDAAVAAALAAVGGSATAPAEDAGRLPVSASDAGEPTKEELADFEAADQKRISEMQAVEELAADLLPLIIAARHRIVFDWLAKERGVSAAGLLAQIVRNEISREMSSYRAAMGGGGNSSKNLEELTARLPKA